LKGKSPHVERPSNILSNINQLDGINDEANEQFHKDNVDVKLNLTNVEVKEALNQWYDVGVTPECSYLIKNFSLTNSIEVSNYKYIYLFL